MADPLVPQTPENNGQPVTPQGEGGQPVNPNPAPQQPAVPAEPPYDPLGDGYQAPSEEPEADDPDLEGVDDTTKKLVEKMVQKAMKPLATTTSVTDNKVKVSTFLSDPKNRDLYGDLESKAVDLLAKNPRISDLKPDALFRLLAGDIGVRIARQQKAADEAARRTSTGDPAPSSSTNPVPNKDWGNATKEQIEEERLRRFGKRQF